MARKTASVDTRKLGLYQSMRGELLARRTVVLNALQALDDIEKRRDELRESLEDIDSEIAEYDEAMKPMLTAMSDGG